jgi:tRNA A-37 threonylcarbamoyl transferase component Bud32
VPDSPEPDDLSDEPRGPTTIGSLIADVAAAPAAAPRAVEDVLAHGRIIGATFGSYRIVAELGGGGMGTVFLGEHAMLGSRAAIKVLRPEYSHQQQVVQRFFDEARAATRVADPGIVTVLDFGWHPTGAAYLVMEHLAGETLTGRIRRAGYLPPAQMLAIVRQVAMAMAAAHARGIVHRDLKPDNIFIVPDPAVASERVKVLDFGIAKLLGDSAASHDGTQTGLILGTPGYMSPEQCRGAGRVDHRTDVYALGCVAFFLLCGRPPFTASTPGDLIASHITLPPPAPSTLIAGVPPVVDALVLRCLAKDADARYQTMRELVDAIDATAAATATAGAVAGGAAAMPRTPAPSAPVADATQLARPAATTLGSSIGQSIELPPRRSRRGAVIGAMVTLGAIGIVVATIASRRGAAPSAEPAAGSADPAAAASTIDASLAPVPDATAPEVPAAAPIDAARPPKKRDRDRPDRPRPATPSPGSAAAPAPSGGSGSPWDHR